MEFKDIRMFGTLLNMCGYDLNVGDCALINACRSEYHLQMFNNLSDNEWSEERCMKEVGMKSMNEGRTSNQLIKLYIK